MVTGAKTESKGPGAPLRRGWSGNGLWTNVGRNTMFYQIQWF